MPAGRGCRMLPMMEMAHPPRTGWRHALCAPWVRAGLIVAAVAAMAVAGGLVAGMLAGAVAALGAALVCSPPPARPPAAPPPAHDPEAPRTHATNHGPDLATLAGRSWMAIETAQSALHAARPYMGAEAVGDRTHRLIDERARTIVALEGLAHDEHTDNPLLHWLAAPVVTRRMLGLPDGIQACVFDLDSVLTTSAAIHATAWAETFDAFLLDHAERGHRPFIPFDPRRDYEAYLAGKPRLDGIRAFLASRGIGLPEGAPDDPSGTPSVRGLAKRKNEALQHRLAEVGVDAFVGSRCYLEAARVLGVHRAVVSASSNTAEILALAQLEHLVEVTIDGRTIEAEHLQPKPAPDTLLAACERLHVDPAHTADFETTLVGVSAARAAGMRMTVSLSRDGDAEALRASDSDVVIGDLADLLPDPAAG